MRRIKKIGKWIGLGLLLLLVMGLAISQIGLAIDAKKAPSEKQMILVDGRRVHIECTGHGQPFVLDSGLGGWSLFWWRIQPQLARLGQVCVFDRAGMGWSEPGDGAFDGISAAKELAEIVKAAKIPTPFIYVGHSLGANFAQIYQHQNPSQVRALVLIEPGRPEDLLEDFEGGPSEAAANVRCQLPCRAAAIAAHFGITRLAAISSGNKSFPEPQRGQFKAVVARPDYVAAVIGYFRAVPLIAYQTIDAAEFGRTPVLFITSSDRPDPEGEETPADVQRWKADYRGYLTKLAASSSNGVGPIEIPGSGHATLLLGETPATLVVREIEKFVAQLPESGSPPAK